MAENQASIFGMTWVIILAYINQESAGLSYQNKNRQKARPDPAYFC